MNGADGQDEVFVEVGGYWFDVARIVAVTPSGYDGKCRVHIDRNGYVLAPCSVAEFMAALRTILAGEQP